MCGITGVYALRQNFSETDLQRMTDAIVHRGPDGEGHWIESNVGLGHRRLSIIDLSPAGHQPMISADHRYILSYNGENQELDLSTRTYQVVEQSGDWLVCGVQ